MNLALNEDIKFVSGFLIFFFAIFDIRLINLIYLYNFIFFNS